MLHRIQKHFDGSFSNKIFFLSEKDFWINWMLNGKLSIIETGSQHTFTVFIFSFFFSFFFYLRNCFHLVEQNPAIPADSTKNIQNENLLKAF